MTKRAQRRSDTELIIKRRLLEAKRLGTFPPDSKWPLVGKLRNEHVLGACGNAHCKVCLIEKQAKRAKIKGTRNRPIGEDD